MEKYTVNKIGDITEIIKTIPAIPGHSAPREMVIARNSAGNDGYKEACRLVAFANLLTAFAETAVKAGEVLESNNPETFL